ncbi:MAG: ATPase P [Deltaproteobacteria bacterium]|nr:ATPase P [Deltaproteobacteria bacterium]
MSFNLDIPGREPLELAGIICDMNGTLTVDGQLGPETAESLRQVAVIMKIYVMTADTFGTARQMFSDLPVELVGIPKGSSGASAKRDFLRKLGKKEHAAIGNGYNDHLMLAEAVLGICVLGGEGAHALTMAAADLIVKNPPDALNLFLKPQRLLAGLRN